MKKFLSIILLSIMLLSIIVGCSNQQTKTQTVDLNVSAAASLTDCMKEIQTAYESNHSNVNIKYNFASSGTLQQQIEQGAPCDVFFSASTKQMTALKDKGIMINSSIKNVLENKVVLITPLNGKKITSFEGLTDKNLSKIAIGDPGSVPVGQYSKEILTNLKIYDSLSSKLVNAKDVKEVLSWVETENADVGMVYATDAKISQKVKVVAQAPDGSLKTPVIYPVGIVKSSKVQSEAQKFIDFLSTENAKQIFKKYGFSIAQ